MSYRNDDRATASGRTRQALQALWRPSLFCDCGRQRAWGSSESLSSVVGTAYEAVLVSTGEATG